MTSTSDVIDLTNSFTLADHRGLSDVVIDLDTDDSLLALDLFYEINPLSVISSILSIPSTPPPTTQTSEAPIKKKKHKRRTTLVKKKSTPSSPIESGRKKQFGGCPICWDELGKNPLASTKCGHVYCLKCLEDYLKLQKKCPICRQSLKRNSAYHPLYLSGT